MFLKMTSVLVSSRRRIQARCKDLVKVTVQFIRRGIRGEKREREAFPVPMQDMGAKTQNGGPQLLVLYWRAGVKTHAQR
jgi:hypothetical protein